MSHYIYRKWPKYTGCQKYPIPFKLLGMSVRPRIAYCLFRYTKQYKVNEKELKDFVEHRYRETLTLLKSLPCGWKYGICNWLYENDVLVPLELTEAFTHWPRFSGNKAYPVPHSVLTPEKAYYSKKLPKWEGEYGEARKELLEFLIKYIEHKLA